jgi:metal-dependent amidase/aminoacylase/carboxypeptidase family protein
MTTRPSDEALRTAVRENASLVRETIEFIHAHPELPHQEVECSRYLMSVLKALGLEVEAGLAGMETGFRATLRGATAGRTVGIVALYDAVASVPPEGGLRAVHSCGHGPIAGSVVGALAALARERDSLSGRVVVMGCPADEIHAPETVARGSGKATSAAAGAWDDVDAAMYLHPEFIDTVSQASLWMRRLEARVAGTRSLGADGADGPPFRIAEAAVAAARSLPAGRGMLERMELDGDVEEGGGLVTRITFLVWADDEAGLEALAAQLQRDIDADWTVRTTVPAIVPDDAVTAAVAEAIRAAGREFVSDPPPLPFATDFGAVSQRVPSALIGVGREGGWAFHTPLGEEQFASEDGVESAMVMAQVLASAASRLSTSD